MAIVLILFWGAVIVLVIAGVRRLFPRSPAEVSWQNQTTDLLAQRFALGEIDEAEYRRGLVELGEGT